MDDFQLVPPFYGITGLLEQKISILTALNLKLVSSVPQGENFLVEA